MRILIVNDDGIMAKGIVTIANALKTEHEVTVIAPDKECSGWGHKLNFYKPVSYMQTTDIAGCSCYKLAGTPCDCPKFGIEHIMKDNPPELVVSGINNGINVATDVIYSGTVNAAIEAGFCGIKSIALSCGGHMNSYDYVAEFFVKNLTILFDMCNPVISINFPTNDKSKIKGYKYTKVGKNSFNDVYIDVPNGGVYGQAFMLTGEMIQPPCSDLTVDIDAVYSDFITITPIKASFTDYEELNKIKDIELCV